MGAPLNAYGHEAGVSAWVPRPRPCVEVNARQGEPLRTGLQGSAARTLLQWARTTCHALVAQGIEHRSPKAGVGRSNRLGGTVEGRHAQRSWVSRDPRGCPVLGCLRCLRRLPHGASRHRADPHQLFPHVRLGHLRPCLRSRALARCIRPSSRIGVYAAQLAGPRVLGSRPVRSPTWG